MDWYLYKGKNPIEGKCSFPKLVVVVKAPPVPAGTAEPISYEEHCHKAHQEAARYDSSGDGPDKRPLGEIDHGGLQGQPGPARPHTVLGWVPCQVDALHAQGPDQARSLVAELVKGVLAVVAAHTTPT